ncbi:hypothetical protein RJ640_028732 [Escallonia rubra]|uniref:VQ domain-containing protein n=1 Tax=Escallonia rubra TaxID=112253 RepID=A0AA88RHR5_9ASTE|nr:hypothetical protein RJ640_028732 [Escallonia rubra]
MDNGPFLVLKWDRPDQAALGEKREPSPDPGPKPFGHELAMHASQTWRKQQRFIVYVVDLSVDSRYGRDDDIESCIDVDDEKDLKAGILTSKNKHYISMTQSGSQSPVGSRLPATTYVHADSSCFRDVVHRLTAGPPDNKDATPARENNAATIMAKDDNAGTCGNNKKTRSFRKSNLHERRPTLHITKPENQFFQSSSSFSSAVQPTHASVPNHPQWYGSFSPSMPRNSYSGTTNLRSPLSKASPRKRESPKPDLRVAEEEKAIKERRYYFHPSPRFKLGYTEPELLTLFPLTSPNATDNKK